MKNFLVYLLALCSYAAHAQLPADPGLAPLLWHLENTGQPWRMDDPNKSGKPGKAGADIHISGAWKLVDSTPDVLIAVIDGGFETHHPDLMDAFDLDHAYSFLTNSKEFEKPEAEWDVHGNFVSGVIGANGFNEIGITGISRRARILPIEAVPGEFREEKDSDVAKAIRYAVDQSARVINCSFGKYGKASPEVQSAIRYAAERNVVIVAGSGNDHRNVDRHPIWPASYSQDFENVISVAATDREDRLWSGSNFGQSVDLGAPGAEVFSTGNSTAPPRPGTPTLEYSTGSGTSLAAPMVAGVAALMIQLDPRLTAARIKKILTTSADALPSLKGKVRSGGRLNAEKALRQVLEGRYPD